MPSHFEHGYALLVGVGSCAYSKWSLPVTVKDVQALRTILTDMNLCAYPNEHHIKLLHDAGATRHAILDGLAWLAQQAAVDPEATIILYYSGHGWLDSSTQQYYLISHDVEPYDIRGTALAAQDFTTALRKIPARRLLVFIDSCHAEGMATAKDIPGIKLPPGFAQTALPKRILGDLKQGSGRAIFTSCRSNQLSWVRPDGALSLYTYHLIEAMQGAGNRPRDAVIRVSNLMNHVSQAVPDSAYTLCGAEQTPFFDTATEDFAVAMLRGGKGLPSEGWEAVRQEAADTTDRVTQAIGTRSVAIGGDMQGSTIITGDHN
jgi:uncharacterized caspase-like protein